MKKYTTKSQIKNALRKLWMWSVERRQALQRDKYTCQDCGVKQSKAKGKEQKVEVHHKKGDIDWDKIISFLRAELFCNSEDLETLCPECHSRR